MGASNSDFVMKRDDGLAASLFAFRSAVAWMSLAVGMAPAAADERGTLEIGCHHDGSDAILDIICRRVVDEILSLAGKSGLRAIDTSGLAEGSGGADAVRAVRIDMDATQVQGPFNIKEIEARMVGTFGVAEYPPWESKLSAKGAPRDLVHPVADALVIRVTTFLASPPGQ